jgi:hypothetical protein
LHDRQRQRANGSYRDRRKGREGAGLAAMISGDFAAPAMSRIEHGAQRAVEGEAEFVGFVDQQGWMLAVNRMVNAGRAKATNELKMLVTNGKVNVSIPTVLDSERDGLGADIGYRCRARRRMAA